MIYRTLKLNKEHDVDYEDIFYYADINWRLVADLFPEGEKYEDGDYTNYDKLVEDYTPRQVASACLKELRRLCKGKNPNLMIWEDMFIDLDCDGEIAYDQLEGLIEDGVITGNSQLREIDEMAKRKGCWIRKLYRYGENDIYQGSYYISDLIDKYFPCYAEENDTSCNDCGNCY